MTMPNFETVDDWTEGYEEITPALFVTDARWSAKYRGGIKASSPHPLSVGAHLPMHGCGSQGDPRQRARAIALWPDSELYGKTVQVDKRTREIKPVRTSINKAHPASVGADLPLAGLGLGVTVGGYSLFTGEIFGAEEKTQYGWMRMRRLISATHKWTITRAEQRLLDARPLRYNREG